MIEAKLWNIFVGDVINFNNDMSTLPWGTTIWACLFPFPQFIFGAASAALLEDGPSSIGAYYLYCRAISFVIAGQVHKRSPFTKKMGPIMHIPLFFLVPKAILWAVDQDKASMTLPHEAWHYNFVVYTTAITSFSLFMDTITAAKWFLGKDVGAYKNGKKTSRKDL